MFWDHVVVVLSIVVEVHLLKIGLIDGNEEMTTICQRAINEAKDNGHCIGDNIDVLSVVSCQSEFPAEGTANAVALYYKQSVDAFIAPTCSDEMEEVSRLAYFFNRPVLTRSIASAALVNLDDFPNVVQVATASVQALGVSIAAVAKLIGVDNLVLVGPLISDSASLSLADALAAYYRENKIIQVQQNFHIPNDKLSQYTNSIRLPKSKLIVITDDFLSIASTLNSLGVNNLVTLGHTVLIVCRQPFQQCITDQSAFASNKPIALVPESADATRRAELFKAILDTKYDQSKYENYRTTFDACYSYCWGSLKNKNDGKTYANTFTNASFTNSMGTTRFDGGYSLMQTYSVYQLEAANANLSSLLTLTPTPRTCFNSTCLIMTPTVTNANYWLQRSNITVDYSGLNATSQSLLWLIIVAGVLVILIVVAIIAYYYFLRRKNSMFRLTWRIKRENLKIIEAPSGKGRSNQEDKSNKRRPNLSYALIGTVKAEFITMKQIRRIQFNDEDMKFLMNLKRINHDNLATMIGVCYNEDDIFYMCHMLVERASLMDLIEDIEFNMDNTFKSAFIRDIVRGLQYLHKTAVGYHGLLNCSNCLIDGNWVLKLSQFGITSMLSHMTEEGILENVSKTNTLPMLTYFSTAPEMMKGIDVPKDYPRGSALGDIFSIGVVMYSILFERQPYEAFGNQKDIIDQVINKDKRPDLSFAPDDTMKQLLERCWDKIPDHRPKMKEIQLTVQKVFASSQGNLIDQMIRMNEKYAQNLENIVSQRESMLKEAQEQIDRLLNEMLPASIAAKLKAKETIEPRSFELATVLFCQLVDFPVFMEKSDSNQIIAFLNDVFERFDEIIKQHDAYKVETTGETYMVASGVPNENDGRHVFEIADIALSIRERSYAYRVAYMPDFKVRVRIGFHCGPIAAGVIGLKSPRYCLFGDTVNFASRMQSNCPPDQIQTSEITARMLMDNDQYELVKRGIVKVKGKGDVNCYWLNEHIHGTHGFVEKEIIVGERPSTRSIRPRITATLSQSSMGSSVEPPVRLMTGVPRNRSRKSSIIEEEKEEANGQMKEAEIAEIQERKIVKRTRFDDKKDQ